jgi:hypothetical protein
MERYNQIDLILIDRRQHSGMLDIQLFRIEDSDTDQCLVVTEVKKIQ